jgi:cell division cycle 2-like protein
MEGTGRTPDNTTATNIMNRSPSMESPDVEARQRELSIRKRIVRPKRIRRHDEEDGLSSPGAGPSTRPRTKSPSTTNIDVEDTLPVSVAVPSQNPNADMPSRDSPTKPKALPPPPRCPYAPTRRSHPPLTSCRSVYNYTRLNHIEEGTYGVVFRAKCNETNEIYALKKLKLEEEKQGFPITSLREVMALLIGGAHENVVGIKEIVVGDTLNQYVLTKKRKSSETEITGSLS